jgi:8-oxo-dGTP pyrophosphatase MutT (NUDIX family)
LFQQRDSVPNIIAPGRIALFGGHREGDETFLACVVREVREELSCFVPPEHFNYLGSYAGADVDCPGGTIVAEYYFVRDVPVASINVTEGALLIVEPRELPVLMHRLASSTRIAVDIFLGNSPHAPATPS